MTIRVGMIGAGAIADDHCNNINNYEGAEMVAVADISRERREGIKKKYGIFWAYEKWEDLVANPDIDAVAIALPTFLHAKSSIAALNAGKHVLLDKPFALNFADAKKVADSARRKHKVFTLGMNQRFRREAQMLRALVADGTLGDIYHAKAFWRRRAGAPRFGTWFVHKKLSGGGCLLDIGVHYLDLVMHIINNWQPVSVSGQVYGKFGHRGIGEGGWGKSDRNPKLAFDVDDFATALIKFSNGASVELNASWVLHQDQDDRNNIEVYGTKAGASLGPLKIYRASRDGEGYETVQVQNMKLKHPYNNRQANWLDAILGKDKLICPVEQSLVVQKVLDAIYASSASGRESMIR